MNKSEIGLLRKNRENQAMGFSVSSRQSAIGMAMQRKTAGRRGTVLVETALVLLILITLIIGGMDFAIQFHVRHLMTGAAREAARYLAVRNGTEAQAKTAALNQLKGYNPDYFTITCSEAAGDVTVNISVLRKDISIGFFPGESGATITAETTMRKEI